MPTFVEISERLLALTDAAVKMFAANCDLPIVPINILEPSILFAAILSPVIVPFCIFDPIMALVAILVESIDPIKISLEEIVLLTRWYPATTLGASLVAITAFAASCTLPTWPAFNVILVVVLTLLHVTRNTY